MAQPSVRAKLTFGTMILGSLVSLALSIGLVYITLPTTLGLTLAIGTGIASLYFQGTILYNALILQKKEKPLHVSNLNSSDKINQSQLNTNSKEAKRNQIKGAIFALGAILSVLITAAAGALGIYQAFSLVGGDLNFSPIAISTVGIFCAAIMGLGYLLAGYDQSDIVYNAITGYDGSNQLAVTPKIDALQPDNDLKKKSTFDYKQKPKSLLEFKANKTITDFFKNYPDFQMPQTGKPTERKLHAKTRRFSF